MFERFAVDVRAIVVRAVEESRLRGDRRVATDHLLLGALHDATVAAILHTDLEAARTLEAQLDTESLRAVGLDVEVRGWMPIAKLKRTPFSSGAREVMAAMLHYATAESARAIAPRHLVLALLDRSAPDPAATLIDSLAIDRSAARLACGRGMAA